MFCVYGVTSQTAKKSAIKKFDELPNKLKQEMNESTYEDWIRIETQAFFEKMKPVRISADLSSPERCNEFIQSCKKTTECRNLQIRIHVIKTSKTGAVTLNKRTLKPSLTWEIYDPGKDYQAIVELANKVKEAA